jgi:putative Ca2+/H+ antiporter (TMEM165/GDT1 family)
VDWRLLASTFALLFLAELGDKTQLAVITLSSKEYKPLPVFFGASMALCFVTLGGVLGGEALVQVVPAGLLCKLSAGAFVLMGVLMWFELL